MEDLLKKIMLAGIGTLALTYEKASSMVDELVQKGQITINQGKQLNEELKKVIDSNNMNQQSQFKEYIDSLNLATKSDIDNLNKRIDDLEKRLNGGN